jgi:arylsulfate sulfotransferase
VKLHKLLLLCCFMVAGASPLLAQFTVTLTPNPRAPQPVGSSITWTATVSGDPDPDPSYEYTFSAEIAGFPQLVRKGYGHLNTWVWTPNAHEAIFEIDATVKNVHAGTQASTTTYYKLTSRLTGPRNVNPTNHPLVAFFSAPFCSIPNFMRVRFTPTTVPPGGISSSTITTLIPCRFKLGAGIGDSTGMNFYIAGMYPSTTYKMHWETVDPSGNLLAQGRDSLFTTGAIPSNLCFPTFSPMGTSADPQDPIVLHSPITVSGGCGIPVAAATDLAGNILWYAGAEVGPYVPPLRTEWGGNYLGFSYPGSTDPYVNGLRESDPAGNPILETTLGAINEQLAARGAPPITSVHHEVRRLVTPNGQPPQGDIMVIGNSEYICTDCQGGTPQNPVDVLYDQIIVLDPNMNVIWNWNAVDFLDVNHKAVLDEKCQQPGGGGCEPFSQQFQTANDWMHSNSLQYEAYDGSIILSSRHQDAVFKVNFANGSGDGHIIWELGNPNEPGDGLMGGPGGAPLPTFTLTTNGAGGPDLGYPWFSHQHDPGFALGGQLFDGSRLLTVFDDGNTRKAFYNNNADSRCQLLAIDETNMTANLNINGDATNYSFALGSSQLLRTGGLACDSGIINMQDNTLSLEVDENGNFVYGLSANEGSYRSFRIQDMYTPVNP